MKISAGLENGQVVTRIANTGRAIPEPFREQLFERFHRAGAAEDVKGHGLGLNIARSLARAMQGEVALERSGADGTEFSLTLPPVPTAA
jgi:signal transduction histidine kinase